MRRVLPSGLCAAFAVFCVFVLAPIAAKADIQTIRSADSAIWGSFGTSLFNYKESITPIPDSEHGWLPSFAAGMSNMTNNNLYVALEGTSSFGDASYKGAYYYAPTVPLQETTTETISTIDGKIGRGFAIGSRVMLVPYAELGFRYWDRNLGSGQIEKYQNFVFLGGTMLQFSPTDRLILSAYGAAGTTFAAQMKTAGDTYTLGNAGAYKLGGKIGYNIAPRVELFTSLDFDHFHYVQSGVVAGAYEPSSFTSDTAWRVGLSYHLR